MISSPISIATSKRSFPVCILLLLLALVMFKGRLLLPAKYAAKQTTHWNNFRSQVYSLFFPLYVFKLSSLHLIAFLLYQFVRLSVYSSLVSLMVLFFSSPRTRPASFSSILFNLSLLTYYLFIITCLCSLFSFPSYLQALFVSILADTLLLSLIAFLSSVSPSISSIHSSSVHSPILHSISYFFPFLLFHIFSAHSSPLLSTSD